MHNRSLLFAARNRWSSRLAVSLLLLLFATGPSFGQTDFYEGKTIRLVIGFSAGGISDLWGRALSRAMSLHIPGDRKSVV